MSNGSDFLQTTSGGSITMPAIGNVLAKDLSFIQRVAYAATASPIDQIADRGRILRQGQVTLSTTPARVLQPNKVTFTGEATNNTITLSSNIWAMLGDRVSPTTTGNGLTAGSELFLGGFAASSINATTNQYTLPFNPGHTTATETLLYNIGGAIPTSLSGFTRYFPTATGTTPGWSLTNGGAAIDWSGGSGTQVVFMQTIPRLYPTLADALACTNAIDITGSITTQNLLYLDVYAPAGVIVKNHDASIAVYIGFDSGISSTTGFLLAAGESRLIPASVLGSLWAVAASGTPVISYLAA
jgi:hypothetical protein